MKLKIITISALAVIITVFVLSDKPRERLASDIPQQAQTMDSPAINKLETKTNNDGDLEISVSPLDLSPKSSEWQFDFVMSTHSIELDQNMTKSVTLTTDRDNKYTPLKWEGDPPGGHHRSGILTFNPISPIPKTIELSVRGIDDMAETKFMWVTSP
ncbi:MAG: hypothetical protein US50_C0056G0005 [Candidatus Nomurabacteria bacterium GW2011_GWB1_37_5]|uniref:Uncharacterized protein n=1 Tax=Candidatus Nomurabacteria bacterium GW2011_GWB1_37_5 TaxID=1618742 RepID=A0A0G0GW11_9BACT|nr:MAG: hypothetical protein US50_C0056G0005 [Candidatus Nomurabacteria bacterium GW2011_GWB1_37_5]